jgi:hypothetical protein
MIIFMLWLPLPSENKKVNMAIYIGVVSGSGLCVYRKAYFESVYFNFMPLWLYFTLWYNTDLCHLILMCCGFELLMACSAKFKTI